MKIRKSKKVIAVLLSLLMVVGVMPQDWALKSVLADTGTTTYTLDTSKDLAAAGQGTYTDGQEIQAGSSNYFTLIASSKTKIDASSKKFDDEYVATQRINFGGVASTAKNAVKIKTTSSAATVKIWWVEGGTDNRQMAILDSTGAVVQSTSVTLAQNAPCMSSLSLGAAGTYYIGGATNNNYIFKIEVTEGSSSNVTTRKAWTDVAAPSITSVALNGGDSSTVVVNYDMVVGNDGADKVLIDVKDSQGTVLTTLTSSAEGTSGSKTYTPTASGDYTFSIKAVRDNETTEKTGADKTFTFELPLATPSFTSATSAGNGAVDLVWGAVKEASSYQVSYSADGTNFSTPVNVSGTSYTVSGLTTGKTYTFKLIAVRALPAATSTAATTTTTVTATAQTVWAFSAFGQGVSSDTTTNGYSGDANSGSVKVWSTGAKGKLVPLSTDGLSFYYTTIPTSLNFTLTATVSVDSWTLSNGQEGFGLMACDRVPSTSGDASVFWNNSYMDSVTKVEYFADADGNVTNDTTAPKISMKLGIGSQEKKGVTTDNLAKLNANDTATVNNDFKTEMRTLETSCAKSGAGTYNLVGNATSPLSSTVANPKTSFKMTIQRNNTGYFVSYTDENGNTTTNKYYDTDALSKLDAQNVYAGFFASRNASITVSDISLTTIDPSKDVQKEEQTITQIVPSYIVESASTSNSSTYNFVYVANADGHVLVYDANNNVVGESDVVANKKYTFPVALAGGNNTFTVSMTPTAGYKPGDNQVLSSYDTVTFTKSVSYNKFDGDIIYVSPDGTSSGIGSKDKPLDIYTAVKYVAPGQKIVLMGGTYNLTSTVTIARGIDGTASNPIYMIADPDSSVRPVLDANRISTGMEITADYWYFQGFDVTNSADTKDGIHLSGSYCTMDNLHTYHNGNTGLQISRYLATDLKEDWPSNDYILNCTSYGNADQGYEDADGFAAKLTVGDGIVFDGCISHNNADDGWDLFAKVETGTIGSVTVQNCVAYANGILEDGTNAGNGNGFKLGGSSLSGYHKLINCVSFDNKAKGIDSNSCPDIQVTNCTTYNNGGSNIALYTTDAANTDFMSTGVISYRTQGKDIAETFKLKGTQDASKVYQPTNYFWNYTGTGSNNSNGTVTDDWFVRLDTYMNYSTHVYSADPVGRNADNTINLNGLLVLSQKAVSIVGTKSGAELNTFDGKVAGVATSAIPVNGTVTSGLQFKSASSTAATVQTGDSTNWMIYLLLCFMAAGCGIFFVSKKRKEKESEQ